MKKCLFLTFLFILIFPISVALADDVHIGNASAQSSVTSTTNGSNCQTHIQTTVNGQTEVLNSTDCGTHTLINSVNGTTGGPTPFPSITKPVFKYPVIIISKAPTATPTPTIIEKHELRTPSLVSVIIKGFEDFFKRFFHAL
ncbi:MAG: hypothetical protein ABSD69_02130 [Candidatus Levyibacteriota bacterium]|jgi:hypothetical protein